MVPALNPAWRATYRCACGASVGTHPDGRPLGTLADAKLREARVRVHAILDPLWAHTSEKGVRNRVYAALGAAMGLSVEECHVARFDLAQCEQAIALIPTLVLPPPKAFRWFAEYKCGCESKQYNASRAVIRTCPKHGNGTRKVHRIEVTIEGRDTE